MPPFFYPICPPQGIVSLRSYIEKLGYEVFIRDFNTDPRLFDLQRKYFELGLKLFPHWKFLNIFRNGPRYFARHQLAWFFGRQLGKKYEKLVGLILNFDGKSKCTKGMIKRFDSIVAEAFKLTEAKTAELVGQIKPDIIGCTMLEVTFPMALAILKTAKKNKPKIKALLGGPLTNNEPGQRGMQRILDKCPWIDTIICGEGEILFEYYLKKSFGNKKIIGIDDLKNAKKAASVMDLLVDINKLPESNFEGLEIEKYSMLSFATSRGCPFNCAFCSEGSFWKRFRVKNIEKVLKELSHLSDLYKNNKFYLSESLANPIINVLALGLKNGGAKYKYDTHIRITNDCLNNKTVKLWAESGLVRARIGVESASSRVLKLMNKQITAEQAKKALSNLARNGIYTSTLWIAGFPGETKKNFLESVAFLKKNCQNIYSADIHEYVYSLKSLSLAGNGINCRAKPVYPEELVKALPLQYFEPESSLSARERFRRISLFEKARIKAGIPNSSLISDASRAKDRWIKLGHKLN